MVCLDHLREMVYFKKNISLSYIHTERNSRFDCSFNGLTYMLCAPQISLELTGGNRDGHWGNLQFVLWRIPLRRGREMGERERGGKNIPQKKSWLEQGRHGKILIFHARERHCAPQKHRRWKNKAEWKVQGLHEAGGTLRGEVFSCGMSGLFSLIFTRVE